jgi:hypothetical protein
LFLFPNIPYNNFISLSFITPKMKWLLKLSFDQNLIMINHKSNNNFKRHLIFRNPIITSSIPQVIVWNVKKKFYSLKLKKTKENSEIIFDSERKNDLMVYSVHLQKKKIFHRIQKLYFLIMLNFGVKNLEKQLLNNFCTTLIIIFLLLLFFYFFLWSTNWFIFLHVDLKYLLYKNYTNSTRHNSKI